MVNHDSKHTPSESAVTNGQTSMLKVWGSVFDAYCMLFFTIYSLLLCCIPASREHPRHTAKSNFATSIIYIRVTDSDNELALMGHSAHAIIL